MWGLMGGGSGPHGSRRWALEGAEGQGLGLEGQASLQKGRSGQWEESGGGGGQPGSRRAQQGAPSRPGDPHEGVGRWRQRRALQQAQGVPRLDFGLSQHDDVHHEGWSRDAGLGLGLVQLQEALQALQGLGPMQLQELWEQGGGTAGRNGSAHRQPQL